MNITDMDSTSSHSSDDDYCASPTHANMDHRDLSQVTLLMESTLIRTALRTDIQQFEKSFEQIIEQAGVFLATTEEHFISLSLVVMDEDVLIRHLCGFLASKLAIEGFLSFHQQTIQRTSGGDASLAKQVKAATVFVLELIQTLIYHKEAADYPGKHLGMMYDRDVKYFGGTLFHLNPQVNLDEELPELDDYYEDVDELTNYYHGEKLSHPLRQLPGNPWHKFFGNFPETRVEHAADTALFRENPRPGDLTVSIPGTILFLIPEFRQEHEKFRQLMLEHSQLPLPLLLEEARKERVQVIQRRLANVHHGNVEYDSLEPLCRENTDMIPRPEYTLEGNRTFGMQNLTVNSPDLIGDALPEGRIANVASQLEGFPARFLSTNKDKRM
ncbi:Sporulation minus regulator 1 [Podospora pseudocomata]|uniref:Sporulation minus regulator 1 n=1 Tax=Podospora pseudocomata TaxID=2093779 RepID=A0ABR0GXW0_9PEZI|nr:Sporulation minus regulator 1 [Podospora pseudocomata]